ncbi:MAG: glycoside hydrolase family 32 protein [Cyclobacteriaceae bacterium]
MNKSIEQSAKCIDCQYRPAFHFTPPANWMNDPNGMFYYEGEYHLFYQYYPDSNVWGPMHWGHAISTDMMNWEHLPIALYPDSLGYIFSGSAVVDHENTSGLGSIENPPIVAIFTYHDMQAEKAGEVKHQTQAIAFSLDKGRTWEKYTGNPVLDNPGIWDFRDPKVSWYEQDKKWIMTLAVKDHIRFYSSPNLIDWQLESEFGKELGAHGGVWECPDLLRLKDENGLSKWALLVSINPGAPKGGSGTQYFIGSFNGKEFIPEDSTTKWLDFGADNYAGVTWSNLPNEEERTLFLGWMSNWEYAQVVPTYSWRSAMTLPRALSLFEIEGRTFIKSSPTDEVNNYLIEQSEVSGTQNNIKDGLAYVLLTEVEGSTAEIVLSNGVKEEFSIFISLDEIRTDRSRSGQIDFNSEFGNIHSSKPTFSQINKIELFLDRSSVELFINDGEMVITELVFPTQPYAKVGVLGADMKVMSVKAAMDNPNVSF